MDPLCAHFQPVLRSDTNPERRCPFSQPHARARSATKEEIKGHGGREGLRRETAMLQMWFRRARKGTGSRLDLDSTTHNRLCRLQLVSLQRPQHTRTSSRSSDRTRNDVDRLGEEVLRLQEIADLGGLDDDEFDPGVRRGAVVRSISEVSKPSLPVQQDEKRESAKGECGDERGG